MQNAIRTWLLEKHFIGPELSGWDSALIIAGILVAAVLIYYLCRFALVRAIEQIVKKSRLAWGEIAVKHGVLIRLTGIIPAIFVYTMLPLAFSEEDVTTVARAQAAARGEVEPETPMTAAAPAPKKQPQAPMLESTAKTAHKEAHREASRIEWGSAYLLDLLQRLCLIYIIAVCVRFINASLSAVHEIFTRSTARRSKPLKVFVQVLQVFMILMGVVAIISILINRSPAVLFAGLGASAAVLMLVFKDTILGLVAGVQLSANDMLRVGDWITMPKYNADGDVIEVSLNAVKVRNFDNTITTIPPYALVSDSFQNWRGMSESGGRRVKRSLSLDMNSVCFCTPQMLDKFRKIGLLHGYLDEKQAELEAYNEEHHIDGSVRVNGRRQTNLGVFRAYVERYLRAHPSVHNGLTCMVRQLQPTELGIPVELYFFTADTRWIPYENIQSDVFDHIIASVPEFGLRVYQNLSGADLLAAAEASRAPADGQK